VGYRLARHDEGARWGEHALALGLRVGAGGLAEAEARHSLGVLADATGDVETASGHYQRAFELRAALLPPDHPDLGIAELNSGEALVALGQINEAMVRFQRAADQFADALPEEHPYHAYPIKGMGLAHLHAGAHEQAIAALERALALLERGPPNDPERAEARWGLARALMSETPGDARGLTLAGEARAQFMALGDDYRHRIEEIDAWLEPRQGGASAGAR
ncbi:MAG: tetratricopeptide repeat protein, partial [Myxococcales bacterium]|nr:tetratricopeptide repeat protein [Myxococcales bacterium]